MIFFVDEDESQVRPFRTELDLRGLKVEGILDADSAYMILSTHTDIDLAIIDVMLAANPFKEQSKFTRNNTRDFTITGLILLDELMQINPDFFPERAVLFTMASSNKTLDQIKSASDKYSIPFLHKSQFPTPLEFGDRIVEILASFR